MKGERKIKKIIIAFALIITLLGCGLDSSEKKDIEKVTKVIENLIEDGWLSSDDSSSLAYIVDSGEFVYLELSKDTKYFSTLYYTSGGSNFVLRYYWLEDRAEYQTMDDDMMVCQITATDATCTPNDEYATSRMPEFYESIKSYFSTVLDVFDLTVEDISLPYDYVDTYNSQITK